MNTDKLTCLGPNTPSHYRESYKFSFNGHKQLLLLLTTAVATFTSRRPSHSRSRYLATINCVSTPWADPPATTVAAHPLTSPATTSPRANCKSIYRASKHGSDMSRSSSGLIGGRGFCYSELCLSVAGGWIRSVPYGNIECPQIIMIDVQFRCSHVKSL